MMHQTLEHLHQALSAAADNKLRSILSILGVTLGIAAVIVVSTISKGGRAMVYSELETFGLKSVWIYRDRRDSDPGKTVRQGTGIDSDDYMAIGVDCCPAAARMSPVVIADNAPLVRVGDKYSRSKILGVNEEYLKIKNDELVSGRPFRAEDITQRKYVAIIGNDVKEKLFTAREDPIGKSIRIGKRKFVVIGALKNKSRDFLDAIGSAGGKNENGRTLVPFTSYQKMLGVGDRVDWLEGESKAVDGGESMSEQIKKLLSRRHGGRFEYGSGTMEKYVENANRILHGVALIGTIAASVALLVGGMGIMSIMSTSVLERTREIGLRKAIGAKNRDILLQFLSEAVVISSIGGILGLLFGVLASLVVAIVAGFPLIPSGQLVVIALIVSVCVGLASGFYPAKRASRMQPVDALRYE
jgi:putative ABC transport system permease protein